MVTREATAISAVALDPLNIFSLRRTGHVWVQALNVASGAGGDNRCAGSVARSRHRPRGFPASHPLNSYLHQTAEGRLEPGGRAHRTLSPVLESAAFVSVVQLRQQFGDAHRESGG